MFFIYWMEKLLHISYKSIMEDYIERHNPKSVAEIEYLTREFERRHLSSWNY